MTNQPPLQSLAFWFTRVQLIDTGVATAERPAEEPRTLFVGKSPRNNKHAEFNNYSMTVEQVQIEEDIERIILKLNLRAEFEQWYRVNIDDVDPFYPTRNCLTRHAQDFFKNTPYILLIEDESIEVQSFFWGDFNG